MIYFESKIKQRIMFYRHTNIIHMSCYHSNQNNNPRVGCYNNFIELRTN